MIEEEIEIRINELEKQLSIFPQSIAGLNCSTAEYNYSKKNLKANWQKKYIPKDPKYIITNHKKNSLLQEKIGFILLNQKATKFDPTATEGGFEPTAAFELDFEQKDL